MQASKAPKMATSYSAGGSVPSYGSGPNPGYTPFQSNPYLSSAFTGMPQQPVYNITQVYNNLMPQQPQQQQQQQQQPTSSLEKYNGLSNLLEDVVLKIAGAVLVPILQNELISFIGN
jgi:hypothetical protein